MSNQNVKELGEAVNVTTDELLRTILGQMFESDNDTSTLKCDLTATDGSTASLEFEVRIISINGTRTDED